MSMQDIFIDFKDTLKKTDIERLAVEFACDDNEVFEWIHRLESPAGVSPDEYMLISPVSTESSDKEVSLRLYVEKVADALAGLGDDLPSSAEGSVIINATYNRGRMQIEVLYPVNTTTPETFELSVTSESTLGKLIKDNKIKTIEFDYSGCGDSGQIDDVRITFTSKKGVPSDDLESDIREAIYDDLQDLMPDYYNNDGGQGIGTINKDFTVIIEHEYNERDHEVDSSYSL